MKRTEKYRYLKEKLNHAEELKKIGDALEHYKNYVKECRTNDKEYDLFWFAFEDDFLTRGIIMDAYIMNKKVKPEQILQAVMILKEERC